MWWLVDLFVYRSAKLFWKRNQEKSNETQRLVGVGIGHLSYILMLAILFEILSNQTSIREITKNQSASFGIVNYEK